MASNITDLPAELIEAVLVLSAASDNPASIAALSQTSRFFYDLIYRSPDQHLWREIFLTTFDDPRPLLHYLDTMSGRHPSFDARKFDWTREYMCRISAATYIRHPPPTFKSITPPKACATVRSVDLDTSLLSIIQALLSVIDTSTPFPSSPPIQLTILTNPGSQEESNSPFTPMINSPPFPPLLLLLTANYNTMLNSLNVTWLHDLLEIGFPPELTRMLLGNLSIDVQGHPPHHPALTPASYWGGSEISNLFHKLVCCTGFIPIPTHPSLAEAELSPEPGLAPADLTLPRAWAEAQSASAISEEEDEAHPSSLSPLPIPCLQSSFYSAEEQYADARILARRRVYDMPYLSPARMWGPFQLVQRGSSDTSTSPNRGENEDNDGNDGDDDDDDDDDNDDDTSALRLIYGINRTPQVNPPIAPYELVPDYVWLASARIVVEANLLEVFKQSEDPDAFSMGDILPLMRKLHTTRMGGSPGYWNEFVHRPVSNEEGEESRASGKGEEVEGWDWAGVGGIWKRCICWLDYRELLIHNCDPERFAEDNIQEACRIIPMTIRITGYSQSALPPGSTTRPLPTIHVEGESIGSDRSLHDVRKVKGTVGMIGDRAIRWSLVSLTPGSSEPEWSSESVQIGGPGAAMGLLGLWTGALHERADPLGPFWAWKVA